MSTRRTRPKSTLSERASKKARTDDKFSADESELSALEDSSPPSSEMEPNIATTTASSTLSIARGESVVGGVHHESTLDHPAPSTPNTPSVSTANTVAMKDALPEATPTPVVPIENAVAPSSDDDVYGPAWLSCEELEKIRGYLDFTEESTNRYAVASIPRDATWGTQFKGRDVSRYLCVNGKPLTAWFTGTAFSLWFQDYFGNPHDKVNIGVGFLRKVDKQATSMWASKTHPVKAVGGDVVYARKFMTHWEENAEKPAVIPFTQMYDATAGMRKKSDMPRKYPKGIPKGSIVLVEAALTRYKIGIKVPGRWDDWNTIWELLSVNLIAADTGRAAEADDDFFAETEEDAPEL